MIQASRASRKLWCLIALLGTVLVAESSAKHDANKPINPPSAIDFSELDKLVPAELQEKNTPGAVITIVSGDQIIYQKTVRQTRITAMD